MDGEVCNDIELTEKHITDDIDEEQKAMSLFGLLEVKKDEQRK